MPHSGSVFTRKSEGTSDSRFAGFRLLGLGFWQAWWMIAMCTDALLPNSDTYAFLGNAKLSVLVLTTLGYIGVTLLSKRFSPYNARTSSFVIAGGLTAGGSLLLPLSLTLLDGYLGFLVFLIGGIAVSIGNAVLLIMWGELWSALATGRVGRHLYLSYAFAFILFFAVYYLSLPISSLFTALFPIASALALRSCRNEPRRSPTMTPLDEKSIPYRRIFVSIFLISVIYGFSQQVVGTFAFDEQVSVFTAQSMLLAGFSIAAIALSMIIAAPEAESITLYKPIIPAMATGLIALVLLPSDYAFVGGGLIILGIYCLDMLIMLTSTDIAYRARIPVALTFGAGILFSRGGTLCGSFAANGFLAADMFSTASRDTLLLIGVVVLVFIGMLFFTQMDIHKLYRRPPAQSDRRSLVDNCATIAEMCNLTDREREVLVLLVRGKTVKGVCEELTIAQGTAKHHVSNIYRKVGVYDRQSLHSIVEQGAVGKSSLETES